MTPRLPVPGSDDNTWGDILNEFLSVEHESNGTLRATGSVASLARPRSAWATTTSYSVNDVVTHDGGLFRCTTAHTAGGSFDGTKFEQWVPVPEAYVRQGDLVVNIRDYGATGDGTTDDTSAINDAIAALPSGGTVYFPAGNYIISNSIVVNAHNVRLLGTGYASAIKADASFPTTGVPMIWVQGPGGSNYRWGPVIEQLFIDGSNKTGVIGIQLDSTYHGQIQHCWVRYCVGIGIYLNGTSQAYGAYTNVTSCQITDGGAGKGLTTNNHEHSIFTGCLFAWHNGTGGIGAQSWSSNMVFQGCKFDVNDISLDLEFCAANVVTGCDFDRAKTNHILLNGGSGTRIIGCQMSTKDGGSGGDMIAVMNSGSNSNIFVGNVALPGTTWSRFVHEFSGVGTPACQYIAMVPNGLDMDLNNGAILNADPQTTSATALTNSGTISTAGVGVARVSPASNVSAITLQVGTYPGQKVIVLNESANTVTFDVAGTSHVADGTSDTITALAARTFVWNSGTSLWYRLT